MRLPLLTVVLASLLPIPCHAICAVEPIEPQIAGANTAFFATILEARIGVPKAHLQNGKDYRISYTFEVLRPIKGNSASVTGLYSHILYHDPFDARQVDRAEEAALAPGQNVLVITSETGEVRFGFCDYMQSLHVDGRKIAPVGNPL